MNWKKIGLSILYPHLAVVICLLPISIAFLVLSLIYFSPTSIIGIISYIFAFYVLLVICFRTPRIIYFFKTLKKENRYLKKWFSDVHLRMNVSLYGSLIWNIAFAILQLILGFYHSSFWFYAMFGYYTILAIMRFFLLRHTLSHKSTAEYTKEAQKSIICGWLLLIMNIVLAIIIFFIVYWNRTFSYHMITTIALATYTFLTFTFAIINLVKYRKYNSPIYSTAKIITLISATVSMLTLETTMLTVFDTNQDTTFRQIILSITGVAVITFAITMAIIILTKGYKKINKK